MNVGLDLGTHTLRALWREEGRLRARYCRSTYAVLPDSELQRRVLEQAGVRHARGEDCLVLIGDDAVQLSPLFHVPCLPLFPKGQLPRENPLARQIIAALVERLLPVPDTTDSLCCFVHPGRWTEPRESEHQLRFCSRLIEMRGYAPLPMPAGMALAYSELVDAAFTGLGMTLGAASCEISLAHQGRELASFSIPQAGDWIDEQFAQLGHNYCWDQSGRNSPNTAEAVVTKEGLRDSILRPTTWDAKLFADLYREFLARLMNETARRMANLPPVLHEHPSFAVIFGGGSTRIPGFEELASQFLQRTPLPIRVSGIRVSQSDYAVARGCLINAELESQTRRAVA
ncbi:MAG TPA: hypothetical protein VHB77_23215 [Planctomycetaceae bacterium]|nr:hypothetical protein [Planctomycetaceae bacterium]